MCYNRSVKLPDELAAAVSTILLNNNSKFTMVGKGEGDVTIWYNAEDELAVRYALTRAGYQDVYKPKSGSFPIK